MTELPTLNKETFTFIVIINTIVIDIIIVSLPDNDENESDSDHEASKYVPMKKSSVIGMRPSEEKIKVNEITNVRQLEMLTRIHIMLAQIAGRSSPHYKDYVLLVYAFVQRIWQVLYQTFSLVTRQEKYYFVSQQKIIIYIN